MLSIITYFGYTLLGFGIGGIAFKGIDAKDINKIFNKFKINKEMEILQIRESKDKQNIQVQQLTKENTELQKKFNRSLRNMELLKMNPSKAETENKTTIDESLDEILKL